MSILLSGDYHANANNELDFITEEALISKYKHDNYKKIKYHIILGDAGFMWPGNEERDLYSYNVLAQRPFPVLCVIGNHEPMLGRTDLPEVDIGIGENVIVVNREYPFIAYLKRGKIYNIENYKLLVLGGALSIDKKFRVPNKSWWKNEYWSEEEKDTLFKLLKKEKNFDYVLSHTGPSRANDVVKTPNPILDLPMFFDEVAALNEKIDGKITCKQWYCGHWHKDQFYYDKKLKRGYQYLYYETAIINDEAN